MMQRIVNFKQLFLTAAFVVLVGFVLLNSGCTAQPNKDLVQNMDAGDYGLARVAMFERVQKSQDKSDRNYVLDRMRLMVAAMADGHKHDVTPVAEDVFKMLTTQGLNKDKTVTSVVINEDLKIWKGEPFEQALAFYYLAMHYASLGSWDNARSAINNSLFHLKDFGETEDGKRYDGETLVNKAVEDKEALKSYKAKPSTFTLGYVMKGVICRQLAKETGDTLHYNESDKAFAKAIECDPDLKPLVKELRTGQYNTLLFVDYGRGPQKIGTGPDKAIAKFKTIVPSHKNHLQVSVSGETKTCPVICDVNMMSQDHMWNNLEDIRIAKSYLGTALMGGGAATMSGGSEAELIAGGVMLLVGAAAKAGAHADTRYCEAIPQSCFIVPLNIGQNTSLTVQLEPVNQTPVKLFVPEVPGPDKDNLAVRYLRLASGKVPPWAVCNKVHYYTPYDRPAGMDKCYPYILGGSCVRFPTIQVLEEYQAAGYLRGMTYQELLKLYKLENVGQCPNHGRNCIGCRHVLDGGNCLTFPEKGTGGYIRLVSQLHKPYTPKTPEVMKVAREIAAQKMKMQQAKNVNAALKK